MNSFISFSKKKLSGVSYSFFFQFATRYHTHKELQNLKYNMCVTWIGKDLQGITEIYLN